MEVSLHVFHVASVAWCGAELNNIRDVVELALLEVVDHICHILSNGVQVLHVHCAQESDDVAYFECDVVVEADLAVLDGGCVKTLVVTYIPASHCLDIIGNG